MWLLDERGVDKLSEYGPASSYWMLLVDLCNQMFSKRGLACYQAHNSKEEAHACLLNRRANEIAAIECVQSLNRVLEALEQSRSHEDDSKQVEHDQGEACSTV